MNKQGQDAAAVLKRKRESIDGGSVLVDDDARASAILKVRDDIDDAILSDPEDDKRPRKSWQSRPSNWIEIAEYYLQHGFQATLVYYKETFADGNDHNAMQKLLRWKRDFESGSPRTGKPGPPGPVYGAAIDNELYEQVMARSEAGLHTDDNVLRDMLLVLLQKYDKEHYLQERGGKNTFTHSWAQRFYARHKLTLRSSKKKLREMPVDFEKRRESYLNIAAMLVSEYNIPAQLVIGGDENNVLFVSRAIRTRAKKGGQDARRVGAISVGADKAQVTTTILITESGDILPHQLIFGGTTNRCHPKQPPPQDCIYSHTKTHWQEVDTYKDVILKIIVPYKNRVIAEMNLPQNQASILKHDLHFTHKDAAVLSLMQEHNIFPLFVPAGCTEILHENEVLINKPFKAAVKSAFRDYMQTQFTCYVNAHRDAGLSEEVVAAGWQPIITMGALKPYMTEFVQAGISAISTEEMRSKIRQCFAEDGKFAEIRSAERVKLAREANTVQVVPDEVELNQEELVEQLTLNDSAEPDAPQASDGSLSRRILAAAGNKSTPESQSSRTVAPVAVATAMLAATANPASSRAPTAALLKAGEFARRLSMDEADVRYLVAQGAIPSENLLINIKDRLRIPESALTAVEKCLIPLSECSGGPAFVDSSRLRAAAADGGMRVIQFGGQDCLTHRDWGAIRTPLFGPTMLSGQQLAQLLQVRDEDLEYLFSEGILSDERTSAGPVFVASDLGLSVDEERLPDLLKQLQQSLAPVSVVSNVQKSVDLSDEDLLEAVAGLGHRVVVVAGESRLTSSAFDALKEQLELV